MAGQAMPTTFEGVKTSPNLTLSLSRATDHARELHQPIVTIEHLLLALTEDPDATGSLEACGVDLARLKTDIASFVSKTAATADTSQFVDEPRQSPQLRGMIDQAAEAAREARRQEINSFIVLAAIVGQEKSDAAAILQSHGFTFNEAIAALKPRPARADAGGTKRAANPDRYDTAGTAAADLPIAPVPIPAAQPATAAEVAAAMARSAESLPPLPVAPPRVLQARPIPSQSLPAGEALVPSPMPRPAPELRQPDARPHPGHGGDEPPSVQPVAVPGRRQPQSVDDIMASVRDKSGQRLPCCSEFSQQ